MAPQSDDSANEIVTFSSTITSTSGSQLFTKYWEPVGKTRALVFIAHGYAEHCLLYDNLAKRLALNNFYVFSHDHVGHGQSEGQRAIVHSFDQFVDDVFRHVDLIRKEHPGYDCFICGHSMSIEDRLLMTSIPLITRGYVSWCTQGGAISILSALRKPQYFKGVILIGPAVATNPEITTPFKIAMAKLLRWIVPQFPVAALDLSLVCSCPKVVKEMEQDPLRFRGYIQAGFGASLIDACKEIQDNLPSITFPFILYHGEEDKLCTPEGAKLMYEKAASSDKCIKMYPKAYHNLLYEPNGIAEQVMTDIIDWISTRA